MMEHLQVRCAILLPFIPLKVRRMKSLALLWATAGPDYRSLKQYWVSAKALTLPISHHGSSQLSLPPGLIWSPERINTQSLCYLCTWAIPPLKSRLRSNLITFWPISSVSPQMYPPQLYWGIMGKESLACTDWKLRIYFCLWLASCDFVKWCLSSNCHRFFVVLDLLPEHWITAEWYHQAVICQISPPLVRPTTEDGIWRCDKGGLGQRQVCRCHAAG